MSSVPRIVRAVPRGPISRPAQGIPVLARIRWHHGDEPEIPVVATAWTKDAVEITWEAEAGQGLRSDWIPATDVHRPQNPATPLNVPPHTRAGAPRTRW